MIARTKPIPSTLPRKVTQGYWAAVRDSLQAHHKISLSAARRGIKAYRAELEKAHVGDVIYHAPIEETACGIATGGYCGG